MSKEITIQGSPYDEIIVRVVDPQNPFPGGISAEWSKFIDAITSLTNWFNEAKTRYQQKLDEWRSQGVAQLLYNYFVTRFWAPD